MNTQIWLVNRLAQMLGAAENKLWFAQKLIQANRMCLGGGGWRWYGGRSTLALAKLMSKALREDALGAVWYAAQAHAVMCVITEARR